MHANAAINSLRGFGAFRYASLRLLEDLIETVGDRYLTPDEVGAYVEYAQEASFSLYASLDLRFWNPSRPTAGPKAHTICLCASTGQAVPLEALGHLLAYSIATQFDEAAAVVSFGDDPRMCLWHPNGFSGPKPLPSKPDAASVIADFPEVGPQPAYHLIFVHPRPSLAASQAQRFHRIVYVNAEPDIAAVPGHLQELLIPAVWGGESGRIAPRFSSFVSTHFLGDREPVPRRTGCDLGGALRSVLREPRMRTQPAGDSMVGGARPAAWRLRRDRCRLALDLRTIACAWRSWSKPAWGHHAFAAELFDEHVTYRESAFRWARAVTNRQVGLALCGNGASSYRMVPLIRGLHSERGVPIDVIAGVGGGALLGAYYAAEGRRGLEKVVAEGPAFTMLAVGAAASPKPLQLKVDSDLSAVRLEELERRFVPLTTIIGAGRSPQLHAVVAGTVGEAVGVAGVSPLLWPQAGRGRTSGIGSAAAMLAAARTLRAHGADMIIACSCIPGPPDSDQRASCLQTYALLPECVAETLTRYTPFGRVSDAIVGGAFLNRQASREMAGDAHLYVEPNPERVSMLESFAFHDAERLVGAAERQMRTGPEPGRPLSEAAKLWDRFRRSPGQRQPR